jgi:hypothetical protein
MTRIEEARRKYRGKSLFDLYVLKEQTSEISEEHKVIVALIEVKKARHDLWTLIASLVAAVAAVASVIGLFLIHK